MNEATRKEACENLRALRKQGSQVAEWYGNMKTSSANAWDHMKNGFSDAYKTLENVCKPQQLSCSEFIEIYKFLSNKRRGHRC